MAKKVAKRYSCQELSAFCLQISLLLGAAIPLDEGLSIMSEDAASQEEKDMLLHLSEEIEAGEPFARALERTEAFPPYVVSMARLGQETGTLDQIMESLAGYYEKEDYLIRTIKNAVTYPALMVVMLLVVLFVLFARVMPIFEDVYKQLGAQMSPAAVSAVRFGGLFSGVSLAAVLVLAALAGGLSMASRSGCRVNAISVLTEVMKGRSRIALAVANRRFTSVLSLTLKSGLELEKGLLMAEDLVENCRVKEKIAVCAGCLEDGASYYEALKRTGLFSGFQIQMIKVGSRSGRLDSIMEEISDSYEHLADTAIDNMIARFEPTIVAVLAVAVGLVLLAVMLPLVGVLSAIG